MLRKILLLSQNEVCFTNVTGDNWAKYNLDVFKTSDFDEAIKELKADRYLLIMLSINEINRTEILRRIKILRTLTTTPITVLADEPLDVPLKIAVLDEGADQLLEPPLTPEEAAASSLALIRRFTRLNKITPVTIYYDHGVLMSIDHRKVFIGGIEIKLQRKEFDILSLLVRNHARVFTYEQIFREVWGEEYVENSKHILWNQIRRLRDKIQVDQSLPQFIKTKHGIGYSFDPQY